MRNDTVETPISINQDANIFVAELDEGKTVSFEVQEGRQVYVICIEGTVTMLESGTQLLQRHDAAEVLHTFMCYCTHSSLFKICM